MLNSAQRKKKQGHMSYIYPHIPTVMDQKRKCSLFAQSLLNTPNTVMYESRESNERENSCLGEQFIRINFSGFIPSSQFCGLEGC